MNLPSALFVLRWMVRDTFRQSLGSRAFWLVTGLSGLAILLCLSIKIEGSTAEIPKDDIEYYGADQQPLTNLSPKTGRTSIAFGLIKIEQGRNGASDVLFLQSVLAKLGAGALGILLVLLWTSGFLPEFLQSDAASVLLAKPMPRWALLVGKYLGVVLFMALETTIFVGGTWLALGWKTGTWFPGYLYTIPIVVITFAILFSFMTLLSVWTRSAIISIVGTLLFWALCAGVTHERHELVVQHAPASTTREVAEAGYWILPKTYDLVLLLHDLMQPNEGRVKLPPVAQLEELHKQNEFHPELSALCSILFSSVVLGFAARRFATADY